MRNERKRFERNEKRLLKYILKTGELPDMTDYDKECLYHCIAEKHYINGIVAIRMISGRIVFEVAHDRLTLTKEALDFCWKPIPWEFPLNILLTVATVISVIVAILK